VSEDMGPFLVREAADAGALESGRGDHRDRATGCKADVGSRMKKLRPYLADGFLEAACAAAPSHSGQTPPGVSQPIKHAYDLAASRVGTRGVNHP
jgi:hypothetical protein